MTSYQHLKKIFKRLSHLQYIHRMLMWDEAVMMPVGAEKWRAETIATLNRVIQSILLRKKLKSLLVNAKQETDLSPWDQANLTHIEKKIVRESCIPSSLKEHAIKANLASEQAWRKMRPQNNWFGFKPYLEKSFLYAREIAKRQAEAMQLDPYDCLIDQYAEGFNQKNIDVVFSILKHELPTYVQKIIAKQSPHSIHIPLGPFAIDKQKALGIDVMRSLFFDFERGRLDVSHHPFCSGGTMDVRITSRYNETEFLTSLFAICHETGHALYEQGMPQQWIAQPVGRIENMAMHESQSLLVEQEVCGSFAFFEYLNPLLQTHFGKQNAFTAPNLYSLVTKVEPGYIRVDADEVTYSLHVILRYELEKSLFCNELTIADLPSAWNELMVKYLGLSTQGDDKNGVMQDVHWPAGIFGYFPAYTLGRVIASQLFSVFKKSNPTFSENIKGGEFSTLHAWLQENVYRFAASLPVDDWLRKVTGESLNTKYYLNHIEERYF